jgi:23S rRNA pseudouridine2605 synthase
MEKTPPPGDRIAKVLARAGIASRRAVEAMIAEGRITVNGRPIDSPALNVTATDLVEVDGKPVGAPEPPRLWLYHKPQGLVTTEKDEKGRPTVFATLPPELGRVVSVGRLDLNSEGLLLLTNDGGLKRRLELPATGWLRRYRVRVHGAPTEATLAPLRQGITVDGERFQPMEVTLDRQQAANAWLTVGLREGKNREVRRAMEAVGLRVNRLIRIGYGPFRLGELKPGEVEEVRRKVLRDQLGLDAALWEGASPAAAAAARPRKGGAAAAGGAPKRRGDDEGRGGRPLRQGSAPSRRPGPAPLPREGAGGAPRGRETQRGEKAIRPRHAGPGAEGVRPPRARGPDGGAKGGGAKGGGTKGGGVKGGGAKGGRPDRPAREQAASGPRRPPGAWREESDRGGPRRPHPQRRDEATGSGAGPRPRREKAERGAEGRSARPPRGERPPREGPAPGTPRRGEPAGGAGGAGGRGPRPSGSGKGGARPKGAAPRAGPAPGTPRGAGPAAGTGGHGPQPSGSAKGGARPAGPGRREGPGRSPRPGGGKPPKGPGKPPRGRGPSV